MPECERQPEYRSSQYFADLLRVSKRTILNMVARGELQGAIRVGGVIRIPLSALEPLEIRARGNPDKEESTWRN